VALRFDVVTRDVAGRIEPDARNFFAAAHTWPDPRQKQQPAYAFRVRERPYRFRGSLAFEGFAHVLFTPEYIDERNADFQLTISGTY
jgi:hypothetical protein